MCARQILKKGRMLRQINLRPRLQGNVGCRYTRPCGHPCILCPCCHTVPLRRGKLFLVSYSWRLCEEARGCVSPSTKCTVPSMCVRSIFVSLARDRIVEAFLGCIIDRRTFCLRSTLSALGLLSWNPRALGCVARALFGVLANRMRRVGRGEGGCSSGRGRG